MSAVSMDRIFKDINRYQREWQSYKKSLFAVDLGWIQRNYAEAPNEETKQVMATRAHYYHRLVEGFEFLAEVS
ncbi:hypothetical protein WDW89_06420 [Deltaproteobacteria bacterium TL4]